MLKEKQEISNNRFQRLNVFNRARLDNYTINALANTNSVVDPNQPTTKFSLLNNNILQTSINNLSNSLSLKSRDNNVLRRPNPTLISNSIEREKVYYQFD